MERSELVVGKVYEVAGQGEMLLLSAAGTRAIWLLAHGGWEYLASPQELVREVGRADLDRRYVEARPRGLDCRDRGCWCRNVK